MKALNQIINNNKTRVAVEIIVTIYMLVTLFSDTFIALRFGTLIQRVAGVCGIFLLCIFALKILSGGKKTIGCYCKENIFILLFFVMRFISFAYHGFDYTIARQIFFEAVYMIPLCAVMLDKEFINNIIVKIFVVANLVLNIIDVLIVKYLMYCGEHKITNNVTDIINNNSFGFIETAVYDNPNHMGLITVLAMVLAFAFLREKMKWYEIVIAIFYYLFSLNVLWRSNCRNAIACLIVLALLYFVKILFRKISNKKFSVICFIVVIISTAGIYGFVYVQGNPTSMNTIEQQLDYITSTRYSIWKSSAYVHKNDILVGGGSITLEKVQRYEYDVKYRTRYIESGIDSTTASVDYVGPHNAYIGIISTAGIIAFIFYIATLYLKISRASLIDKKPYMFAVIYILIMNVFECRLITGLNIYCLMLYLILAPEREEENKLPEPGLQAEEVSA